MPTIKQKQTAEKTLENIGKHNPLTKGQVLAQVGYSKAIVKNPKAVYETAGYKEALDDILTENKIDKNSRLKRLADIFWGKSTREALGANKEITLMLGEYAEKETKMIGLFSTINRVKEEND